MSEIIKAIEGLERLLKSLPATKKEINKEAQKAVKKYFSDNLKERRILTNARYSEIRKQVYLDLEKFYTYKREEIKGEIKELIDWIDPSSKSDNIIRIEKELCNLV